MVPLRILIENTPMPVTKWNDPQCIEAGGGHPKLQTYIYHHFISNHDSEAR